MPRENLLLIILSLLFITSCYRWQVIEEYPVEAEPEEALVTTKEEVKEPETLHPDTLVLEPQVIEEEIDTLQKAVVLAPEDTTKSKLGITHIASIIFNDIYFDFGRYEKPSETVKPDYLVPLNKVVKVLKSDEEVKVRLYGYTDSAGSEEFNKTLAEKRAATVGKLIINYFTSEEQGKIADRIEIVPIGEEKPLAEGPIEYRNVINRRVSIELFYGDMKGESLSEYLKSEEEIKKVSSSKEPTKPKSPQEILYENALKFFENKQYDKAIMTFEEILSIDSKHSLADNAQWWIGEAYYFQGRYGSALSAYKKVFGLGDRNKEAYAQLRIGYCLLKLNQKDKAIEEFKKVTSNYPNAKEEIDKARRVLARINSGKF